MMLDRAPYLVRRARRVVSAVNVVLTRRQRVRGARGVIAVVTTIHDTVFDCTETNNSLSDIVTPYQWIRGVGGELTPVNPGHDRGSTITSHTTREAARRHILRRQMHLIRAL